jgi:lysozyme
MFSHDQTGKTGEESSPHLSFERPAYHRPNAIVRLFSGRGAKFLIGSMALLLGLSVGANNPQWFSWLIADLNMVTSQVEALDDDQALGSTSNASALVPTPGSGTAVTNQAVVVPDECQNLQGADPEYGLGSGPGGSTIGINVSKHNKAIPWRTARQGGVSFAYAMASSGTKRQDSYFTDNWDMMKNCGILRGVFYEFDHSRKSEDQAATLIASLPDGYGDLPPAISLRGSHNFIGGCRAYVEALLTFTQNLESEWGVPPLIFTSESIWNEKLKCTSDAQMTYKYKALMAYPLWLDAPDMTSPELPGSWHRYEMLRFTDDGRIGGGTIPVEAYNGSRAQLMTWASGLKK